VSGGRKSGKAATALGALLVGLVLALIDFPTSAAGAVISDAAFAQRK
jgi:hypothetical protein